MEKFRRLVVTKLDNYCILCSAFYLIFEFLLFYLLHLIFLKSFFFSKNNFLQIVLGGVSSPIQASVNW